MTLQPGKFWKKLFVYIDFKIFSKSFRHMYEPCKYGMQLRLQCRRLHYLNNDLNGSFLKEKKHKMLHHWLIINHFTVKVFQSIFNYMFSTLGLNIYFKWNKIFVIKYCQVMTNMEKEGDSTEIWYNSNRRNSANIYSPVPLKP